MRVADGAALVPPTLPRFNYSPEIAVMMMSYGQLLLQRGGTTRESKTSFDFPLPLRKNPMDGARGLSESGVHSGLYFTPVFSSHVEDLVMVEGLFSLH